MEAKAERIVVGVDGSDESIKALEWAVRQASLTGAVVEAVHAWEIPAAYGVGVMLIPNNEEFDAAAKQALTQAVGEAAVADSGVEIVQNAVAGHASRVLIETAEHASLLVVGSRGRGGFVGMLLGSVSQHCVAHAPCPVVVVRNTDR